MEKNLSELLSYFEAPSYVISLVGIALYLIRILNPITLFSSNVVEKKLFSKERLFFVAVCKYFAYGLYFGILFMCISISFNNSFGWTYNEVRNGVSLIFIALIIMFSLIANETQNTENVLFKARSNKIIKLLVFSLYLIASFTFYINSTLLIFFSEYETSRGQIFALLILFLICAAIPFISRPVIKFINGSTKKVVYITDENNNDWFILHPINKEIVLLGDNSDPKRCEKTMLKKLEDIYNEPITLKIEDN
ncbi:hypothetical protein ABE196_03100 [Bacillus subtilis]|uniref:hypothetical protein n=1 Tax=Bacillus TaxID=1386 RepID=UPI00211884DB|nr:hypothetical protein [Bacillus halotolerans]UUI85549.1 hypothetical protein NPA28_06555 [Bacillus halotolerans]